MFRASHATPPEPDGYRLPIPMPLPARAYTIRNRLRDCLLWLLLAWTGLTNAGTVGLTADPVQSSDGSVRLSWSLPEGATIELQRDSHADFRRPVTLYRGPDPATVITGLDDGSYHFRARTENADGPSSDWSEVVTVTVRHHPLSRALLFFTLGAVVFLATLLLVVTGSRHKGKST